MPNIFVQGGCSNLKKKFRCLPRQLQHLSHLSSVLGTAEGHYFFFYNRTGEYAWKMKGEHVLDFLFPSTAFHDQDHLQPLLYAEHHSTIHSIYKTSNSHCSLLGTSQLINLFPEMLCPRPKAVGEATAVAVLSVLCRTETLLHAPCRLCSNLRTAPQDDICLGFFRATLSICIQPVICKRMQIFLRKAAT